MPSRLETPLRPIEADDPLRASVKQVRTVLVGAAAEDPQSWTGMAWYALARLERVLADEVKTAGDDDGLLAEIDHTRATFVRQQVKICECYRELLEECIALKWEMYSASQTGGSDNPSLGKRPPQRAKADGGRPDFTALKQHVEKFIARVERCREDEAKLILESSTTDIGAGD